MKKFLHVGCGPATKAQTVPCFAGNDWEEVRFDIDPAANPHIIGTMTDMSAVETGSFDALYSSHNIEHLYPHEVTVALREFNRVLKPDGFLVVTCPDLKAICKLVAEGNLTGPAYTSPAGVISAHEVLYGFGPALANGNLYMAHHCGFTLEVLFQRLAESGFVEWAGSEDSPFAITAVARKRHAGVDEIRAFARSVLGR